MKSEGGGARTGPTHYTESSYFHLYLKSYRAYTCKPYTPLRKSHDIILIDAYMADCASKASGLKISLALGAKYLCR
jgi:hypothetical protein